MRLVGFSMRRTVSASRKGDWPTGGFTRAWQDCVMDWFNLNAVDVAVGFFTGLASAGVAAWLARWWGRRRQIRSVDAKIVEKWSPLTGDSSVLESAELQIVNRSKWEIPEVIVVHPEWLHGHDEYRIFPGEPRVKALYLESVQSDALSGVELTLQVRDHRGRTWLWTPQTREARNLMASIRLHSRAFQALARVFPRSLGRWVSRLPPRMRNWLWGYDPSGLESER